MVVSKKKEKKTEYIGFRTTNSVKKAAARLAKLTGRKSASELIHDILEEKLLKQTDKESLL